jgi:hypothetical protein
MRSFNAMNDVRKIGTSRKFIVDNKQFDAVGRFVDYQQENC